MNLQTKTVADQQHNPQKGATTVEYAVIIVAMILAIFATITYLANPNDSNSLLPGTYNKMANQVGNFDIKNIAE